MDSADTVASTVSPPDPGQLRRVAVASLIGTAVEYYDFFIYGLAAALVFGTVFFPALGAAAGTVAAFATFAVAFVARPLGSVVFGHLGDRVGRRRSLMYTLVIMGAATVAIGLLPGAATIGVAAPILLVVLRFVQGIAVGGEFAGAALMVAEYAPRKKRGLYGMCPWIGTGLGATLAPVTFLVTGLTMSPEAFVAWGWRVPFLLSIVLVGVGIYVRVRIEETPVFQQALARRDRATAPFAELWRHQWREVLLVAGAMTMWLSFFYIGSVFFTAYATTALGIPRPTMLLVNIMAAASYTIAVALPAMLSDRFGRRRMILLGNLVAIAWGLVVVPLVDTASVPLVAVAMIGTLLVVSIANGPSASFLPEIFRTRYRTTGVGVAFNLGSVLGGAIPPLLAAALVAGYGSYAIGLLMVGYAVLSTVCVAVLRETAGVDWRAAGSRGTDAPAPPASAAGPAPAR